MNSPDGPQGDLGGGTGATAADPSGPDFSSLLDPARRVQIPDRLYFRIGDVADLLRLKPYVLRYWETEFPMISPQKSNSGQRVYRRSDVETLLMIKHLLYEERYSIEGARRRIRELRKEGELKSYKKDTVALHVEPAAPVPVARFSEEKILRIRLASQALRTAVKTPLSSLFTE